MEQYGADVNHVGKYSGPLHAAVCGAHQTIVKYLLEKGADVNKIMKVTLQTPKHIAYFSGHLDIADLLTSSQADSESRSEVDCNNCTPIDLLSNPSSFYTQDGDGAPDASLTQDVNLREAGDVDGNQSLDQAVAELSLTDKSDCAVICGTCVSPVPKFNLNIVQAIESGNINEVIKLISSNQDWNQTGCQLLRHRQTLLHLAAEHPYPDIVKLLIKKGCSVEATDNTKLTPLTYACRKGLLQNVKTLLKCNARVNAVGKYSGPLLAATDKTIIKCLLKHPAINVNIETLAVDDRHTPLHCACDEGDEEKVKLLLFAGASTDIPNDKDLTPSELPRCSQSIKDIIRSHQDVMDKLLGALRHDDCQEVKKLAHSKEMKEQLKGIGNLMHLAAKYPNATCTMMKFLAKELKISVNRKNILGQTPLMIACQTNDYNKVITLCKLNANFNLRTDIGATLLHIAARHSSSNIVKDLITKYELQVNEPDNFGRSPLTWACSTNNVKKTRVKILLSYETIRVNAQTQVSKDTALSIACRANNKALAQILRDYGAGWDIANSFFRTPYDEAVEDIRTLWVTM